MNFFLDYTGDGLTESERQYVRDSERLDLLEAQLFALEDFQNEAFDLEGDELVLAAGADAFAVERAIETTLRHHCDALVGRYTRTHFLCRPIDATPSQQMEALEDLIRQFTPCRVAQPSLPEQPGTVPSPRPADNGVVPQGSVGGASYLERAA
jgi:hypothetical protein